MRFVSTALVMMAIALMLLALMLLTPTVRANQMTFVANLAGVNAESILSRFARVTGVPSENSDSRTSMGCDAAMLGEQLASNRQIVVSRVGVT